MAQTLPAPAPTQPSLLSTSPEWAIFFPKDELTLAHKNHEVHSLP